MYENVLWILSFLKWTLNCLFSFTDYRLLLLSIKLVTYILAMMDDVDSGTIHSESKSSLLWRRLQQVCSLYCHLSLYYPFKAIVISKNYRFLTICFKFSTLFLFVSAISETPGWLYSTYNWAMGVCNLIAMFLPWSSINNAGKYSQCRCWEENINFKMLTNSLFRFLRVGTL